MGDLNLGEGEQVIRRFDRIIISGVRHEAVLTDRRLVLMGSENGQIQKEGAYADIVLANLGTNRLREPEVSLSFSAPAGGIETLDLIFPHQPGGQNILAGDQMMDLLRDHNVPTRRTASASGMGLPSRIAGVTPSSEKKTVSPAQPPAPSGYPGIIPRAQQAPVTDNGAGGFFSPALRIAGALIVVLVIIAGVIVLSGISNAPKEPPVLQPAPTFQEIPVTPALQAPPASPAPVATITPVAQPGEVPANGTWVRISCPGNYTGNLKAGGWSIDINATGTNDYLLPVRDSLIQGSITKSAGTGETLIVGIYYYGKLLDEQSTYKPLGVINLNLDIQKVLAATPTPTPTPPTPTPVYADVSIPEMTVPDTGVWARVYYPGEYAGTISANGRAQVIENSGDRLFHMVMSGGSVDGSIVKQDYSGRHLAIQIYKDGVMVAMANTTAPHGEVIIHAMV